MKNSLISTLFFCLTSFVMADLNYFKLPHRGMTYSQGDCIEFIVDEVTNDSDDTLKAVLYYSNGDWLQDIGTYYGSEISGDADFFFTWEVDVEDGEYFMRVFEIDGDDDNHDNDDDINRSFTFTVGDSSSYQSTSAAEKVASVSEVTSNKEIVSSTKRKRRSIYSS